MQKDVVEQILRVEDTADSIIENAKTEAKKIVQQAEADSARMIREASEKSAEEGAALVREAEENCKAHIADYEAEMKKAGAATAAIDDALLSAAADKVIDIVVKTEVFGA